MTVNALKLANSNPYAVAYLKGDKDNPKLKGKADMGFVSKIIREKLS